MDHAALKGQTAIVTGASGGIGKACAQALARDGATVLIMGRNEDRLGKAREEILEQTPDARVEIFAGDACQEDAVKAAVQRAYGLTGRLDIVVPVVGGPEYKLVVDQDAASIMRAFELNFLSAFLLIHHGLPLMKAGGTIVCISTIVAGQANPGLSAYGATKAMLERYVRGAAFELGSAGIRINVVRPGVTAAPNARRNPAIDALYSAETPLGRVGTTPEVASVVRFLAGPESGWVTGETIAADGGAQQGKAPDLQSALASRGS